MLTVPLILYWITKLFVVYREKLSNLRKDFENGRDRLWPAFKIGELALAGFQNRRVGSCQLSKSASCFWPAFKIGELALASFQNRRADSVWLWKALGTAPRNLLSKRSKEFELAGFKKLSANSKAFRAKRLRNYEFKIKLKGQFKKLWISTGMSPNQGLSNHTILTQF